MRRILFKTMRARGRMPCLLRFALERSWGEKGAAPLRQAAGAELRKNRWSRRP